MEPAPMTLGDTFDAIYRDNRWNGVESLSGPGSGTPATARVRDSILQLVAALDVQSVLDVGCGDGWWMPDLPGYVGVDVSAEAIERARKRHPDRLYVVGELATMVMPDFDLVIVRDALQHLPLADGLALLDAIRATGSRLLFASTYVGGANEDVAAGDCYSPDLQAPPFSLGEPDLLLFDGYHYHQHDTGEVRDPRKHLGLWSLA